MTSLLALLGALAVSILGGGGIGYGTEYRKDNHMYAGFGVLITGVALAFLAGRWL